MSDEHLVAIHEAGHAAMMVRTGARVRAMYLVSRYSGLVLGQWEGAALRGRTRRAIDLRERRRIGLIAIAGPLVDARQRAIDQICNDDVECSEIAGQMTTIAQTVARFGACHAGIRLYSSGMPEVVQLGVEDYARDLRLAAVCLPGEKLAAGFVEAARLLDELDMRYAVRCLADELCDARPVVTRLSTLPDDLLLGIHGPDDQPDDRAIVKYLGGGQVKRLVKGCVARW